MSKSSQNLHVFLDIDFGRILGGFWEGKILDFRTFFVIFSMQNLACNLEGQKIEKKSLQDGECENLPLDSGHPRPPGERKREGSESLTENLSLTLRAWSFVMGPELLITDLIVIQHASHHLRWAAD